MRIMLVDGASERRAGGLTEQISEHISIRFGRSNVAWVGDEGRIEAIVVPLDGARFDLARAALVEGLHWARRLEVPMVAALANGAELPNFDDEIHGASALPSVEVSASCEELIAVLEWLEGKADKQPAPGVVSRRPPTHARRSRQGARGDPILLKISATSATVGALLWATAGLGPASLFLFLGGVTFLLSRPPPEPRTGQRPEPPPRLAS